MQANILIRVNYLVGFFDQQRCVFYFINKIEIERNHVVYLECDGHLISKLLSVAMRIITGEVNSFIMIIT